MKPTETRHRPFARPGAPGGEPIERELVELFRSLPEVRPRAGFADRVMARIARPSWFARPAVRFLVAAAVAFAALSAALLLPVPVVGEFLFLATGVWIESAGLRRCHSMSLQAALVAEMIPAAMLTLTVLAAVALRVLWWSQVAG